MRVGTGTLAAAFALALGACSGTLGSGSGLALPQTPQNAVPGAASGQPGAAGALATTDRQRVLDGSVTLDAGARGFALPALGGYAVSIDLGSAPGASPSPAASTAASAPAAAASSVPSTPPSPGASGSASPSAAVQKMAVKTTIYPHAAPAAPTAQPSAQPSAEAAATPALRRTALVRGYFVPARDLALYGLAAVHFSIPNDERTDHRGFTVAVFQAGKKGHDTLLQFDDAAALKNEVVAATNANAPLALKKSIGYVVLLYADELPATPAPVGAGYPSPGNNPFVTPVPGGMGAAPGTATAPPLDNASAPAARGVTPVP